uniref:Uncharacterized protein n=1 Tax=Pinguiococcus pyrenoidosus TaxID=172671 RepID=A0A7R9YDW7_9STRA|mmetsp:Transcript_5468/g.21624  ORF Transcript_5468/g.21624 Transcript_5468/m.21624 type:complete len:256 (+) Transcript_5468:180-947(+)
MFDSGATVDSPAWAQEGASEEADGGVLSPMVGASAEGSGEADSQTWAGQSSEEAEDANLPPWMSAPAPENGAAKHQKPPRGAWEPSWARSGEADDVEGAAPMRRPLLGDGYDAADPICCCFTAKHLLVPLLGLAAILALTAAVVVLVQPCPTQDRMPKTFILKVAVYFLEAVAASLFCRLVMSNNAPIAFGMLFSLLAAVGHVIVAITDAVSIVESSDACDSPAIPFFWVPTVSAVTCVPWALCVWLFLRLYRDL